jgi:hypothetical protein
LADLNWEILRLRRAVASALEISFKKGLYETFKAVLPMMDSIRAEHLADLWYEDRDSLKSELAEYGLEADHVVGQVFLLRCDELEKMQRMLTATEIRRAAIVRSLDEYRVMSQGSIQAIPAEQVPLLPGSSG